MEGAQQKFDEEQKRLANERRNAIPKEFKIMDEGNRQKYTKYAERLIERYDANGDKVLDEKEWGKMLMSPKSADFDNSGEVTIEEYAAWMASRSRKSSK